MSNRLSWAVVSTVACLVSFVPSAGAQSDENQQETWLEIGHNQGQDGSQYDIGEGSGAQASGSSSSGGSRLVGRVARPPVYPAYFPALVTAPDGGYCIRPQRRLYSDPETAALYTEEQQFRWMMLAANGYELCAGAERPPGVPAVEAAEFWRVMGEDLLPKPQPRIAPGYMLAGKVAYLEANSSPTARFEHGTPIGNLVITAKSTVWVDWGDGGGLTGPHDGPGLPWPDGKITHFWTDADAYDVRVVQRWTATWELAGRRGTLGGLSTEGLIDDFPVRQLEAVRNR